MPKINQEEYEILKSLDGKWKWIARDEDGMYGGDLFAYSEKQSKNNFTSSWGSDDYEEWLSIANKLFQFIQWEDESPYNIAELIEEYEEYEFYDYVGWEYYEREETEVKKDIEWLKEEIGELPCVDTVFNSYGSSYVDSAVPVMTVYDLINQLDEAEVLSQEWIDEYSYNIEEYWEVADMMDKPQYAVSVENLQNLLVPKQDLPVIPQFVAEWMEKYVEYGYDLYPALKKMENNARSWERIYDWYRKNTRKFVNAYLTGEYEVEEEPKFYVLDSEGIPLLERANNQTCKTTTGLSIYEDGRDNSRFELTEQEIKDYDKRYMTFAEPVEELGIWRK